ncbi:MAG: DUF177 domain-containing protein [Rhodobacteraceae bacterium]|nr:DUF177 domain-containing protein [Paracoccaceae bacterium]
MPKPEPQPANPGLGRLSVRDLDPAATTAFDLVPDAAVRADLAAELDLLALKKLRFQGNLVAVGAGDWRLTAQLGATLVQACIATGAPVTTRIDTDVRRLFRADMGDEPLAPETEFDGDDESEPLESHIDIGQVMRESLALEVPDYPRLADQEPVEASFAPPGADPIADDSVKPFASLAALRDKMKE